MGKREWASLGIGAFVYLLLCALLVNAGDTSNLSVDILGPPIPPPSVIGVSVPGEIFIGNVSVGESVRTSGKIRINNTGNVNITITPQLVNSSDTLFSNLYFSTYAADSRYPKTRIGNFSMNISTSQEYDDFYIWLDLTNYSRSFTQGSINRFSSDVKFVAVAQ